ncbi:MAG: Hsp20/alpha crystallin family protein [Tannerella sp.]|jgi:HSP20 family protein|nr:Hsp20/alpha crystallin family protein [Tannerella sp.]
MTTVVRRNPNHGWLPFFFNDMYRDECKAVASSTIPAINVKETVGEYCVEVAAAGMTKDDFAVNVNDDNDLVITMEKKNESKDENREARYLRREFSYSKFSQTLVLPDDVNKEKIEAKAENGVLSVVLPKLSEKDVLKRQRAIAIV